MKTYRKYFNLAAPPEEVYQALTHPVTLELWTGEPAVMTAEPGTEFSLWDGSIQGVNIRFEPGRQIVQQWYFEGQEEKSLVTITLTPEGKDTRVEVLHINIPDEAFENIVDGWDHYYFKPLKQLVEE